MSASGSENESGIEKERENDKEREKGIGRESNIEINRESDNEKERENDKERRRTRLEIIIDILNLLNKASFHIHMSKARTRKSPKTTVKPTHIMYKCNLSHQLMKKYIEELSNQDLIAPSGRGYTITEKGKNFLRELEKLKAFMESFGL